jgi:hypothetical protein
MTKFFRHGSESRACPAGRSEIFTSKHIVHHTQHYTFLGMPYTHPERTSFYDALSGFQYN